MASSVIHIVKSNFSNNFASVDGGVIYARKDNQIFLNSGTFSENFASYGGVIKVNSSLVEIQNCMFSNNTADDGGVLYLDSKYPYLLTSNVISILEGLGLLNKAALWPMAFGLAAL